MGDGHGSWGSCRDPLCPELPNQCGGQHYPSDRLEAAKKGLSLTSMGIKDGAEASGPLCLTLLHPTEP